MNQVTVEVAEIDAGAPTPANTRRTTRALRLGAAPHTAKLTPNKATNTRNSHFMSKEVTDRRPGGSRPQSPLGTQRPPGPVVPRDEGLHNEAMCY